MTNEETTKYIALNVRKALKKAGYTIEAASRDAGIAATTLTRRLQKPESFTMNELFALANITKRSPMSFLKEPAKGWMMIVKEKRTIIVNQHAKNIIYITNVENINELENEETNKDNQWTTKPKN